MKNKKRPFEYFYFMMNKAHGEVCSTVSDLSVTVFSHFTEKELLSNNVKLHTIGRLDKDTTGLLLFTNDGFLSNFLTRPENKIEKTYFVTLKNKVSLLEQKEYSLKAKKGLTLLPEKKALEQKSAGAVIKWQKENECFITVTEGKFHEVKRIFLALGNEVTSLKRINFAGVTLDPSLQEGKWRALTSEELEILQAPCTKEK